MTIAWRLNRLRAMSAREIAHRASEKSKKLAAKTWTQGWSRYQSEGGAPILPGLGEYVAGFDAQARQAVARAAAATLAGSFAALGRQWPPRHHEDLFPAELWRLDPVTGTLWPGAEAYCFDIPYRHDRERGDVKYVWEINRLQFLQPLAAQVVFAGDDRALAAIESAIASWRAANPPFRCLAWNSGVEIALRAISLLIVSSLIADRLAPEAVAAIRAILAASLDWLARFPSLHSSANNHRIAEAAGQYLIALAMPDLPRARRLQLEARRVLEREAQAQFHVDGVAAEQSPTYGAFSADFLALCDMSAPLAAPARARLDLFADVIHRLADDRGRIPSIGDDDEGRVLAFTSRGETYAVEVASRIKPPPAPRAIAIFRDGGLSVIRHAGWRLVFDHGPLGYLAIAAHGHADALSVCASLDGEPLFVDPGTYLYHSGGEARDWFRGTPAHNTLNIGGENQSVISGPFNWSHKARCQLDSADEGADWRIVASHDGYQSRFGVRHQRTIAVRGAGFCIEDRLLGGVQRANVVFQLAADLVAIAEGAHCRISCRGRPLATLRFDPRGEVVIASGCVSPAFGVKREAPRLVWTGEVAAAGARVSVLPA